MVFMGGHVSGAHYNPAVTLGVFLRGKIPLKKALFYVFTQVLAAITASACGYWLTGVHPAPGPAPSFTSGHAFVVEVLYTLILVLVVLNVATTESQEDNSFFGLAIGFIVCVGAFSVGGISGAVFNPAVGTGLLLVHAFAGGSFQDIWIFWLAPLLGAVGAALVFRITNPREFRVRDPADLQLPLNRPEI